MGPIALLAILEGVIISIVLVAYMLQTEETRNVYSSRYAKLANYCEVSVGRDPTNPINNIRGSIIHKSKDIRIVIWGKSIEEVRKQLIIVYDNALVLQEIKTNKLTKSNNKDETDN